MFKIDFRIIGSLEEESSDGFLSAQNSEVD